MNRPPTSLADRARRAIDPSDMLRVCCWCDPAGAADLAEQHADPVQYGMCGDCLDDHVRALAGDVEAPARARSRALRLAQ